METAQQLDDINQLLDKGKYNNLNSFLRDFEWDLVGETILIPKNVRKFAKAIHEEERRLDVLKFLHKYARQYFYDAAEHLSYLERVSTISDPYVEKIKTPDEYILRFQQEVAFLIDQIETAGEFSGDRLKKLTQRIAQLEDENREYKNANKYLQDKVNRFENPHKYGKFIPAELKNGKFSKIMQYLQMKEIVMPLYPEKDYTRGISCYQWYGSCALFGYFVWKLNQEFELNEARDLLNWQVFETAINNYDKLIKEARKAVSKFRKDDKTLLPAKADCVEEAIKYANGELD